MKNRGAAVRRLGSTLMAMAGSLIFVSCEPKTVGPGPDPVDDKITDIVVEAEYELYPEETITIGGKGFAETDIIQLTGVSSKVKGISFSITSTEVTDADLTFALPARLESGQYDFHVVRDDEEILLRAGVKITILTVADEPNEVILTVNGESPLSEGSSAGVFMAFYGAELEPSVIINGLDNTKYTLGGGRLTASNPDYYPLDERVDFIGYAPYRSNVTDYKLPVDVSDQSAQDDLILLYSNNARAKHNDSGEVEMEFTPKMTRVLITATKSDAISQENFDNMEVFIEGMPTTSSFRLSKGTHADLGGTELIKAYQNPADKTEYRFTLIPVDGAAGRNLIFRIPGEESDIYYPIDPGMDFQEGKMRQFLPTFNKEKVYMDIVVDDWNGKNDDEIIGGTPPPVTELVYAVGDYYPDPKVDLGNPDEKAKILGVVFWVDPASEGKAGKVVGLTEDAGKRWSTESRSTKATSEAYGRPNMEAVDEYIDTYGYGGILFGWEAFPAFQWVRNLNGAEGTAGKWYLPAWNELMHLYCGYNAAEPRTWSSSSPVIKNADAMAAFNLKLTEAGGTALQSSGMMGDYISSTDMGGMVSIVDLTSGRASMMGTRSTTYRVRAIMEFEVAEE